MITEWIIKAVTVVLGGVASAISALVPSPPGWIDTGLGKVGELYGYASGLGSWLPINFIVIVIGSLLALQAVAVVMRLARIGASYATFGGGAVAD